MAEQFTGKVQVLKDGNVIIEIDGNTGNINAGGNGQDGELLAHNREGNVTIHLRASDGLLRAGGHGTRGLVEVRDPEGRQTIALDGATGNISAGGKGQDGEFLARDEQGNVTIHVRARDGLLRVGGWGPPGRVSVRNPEGNETIALVGETSDIGLGGHGQDGDLYIRNQAGKDMIHLDGNSGDIILHNADFAEDFDIAVAEAVEPGTVMVLDDTGALCASSTAYDRRVAGVVSGAGEHKPGIILDKQPERESRLPVALVGKVFCKVDATYGAIAVGDLLTTSPTPGHAMKVSDHTQALGAILGKALRPLPAGTGLIPILVALQ